MGAQHALFTEVSSEPRRRPGQGRKSDPETLLSLLLMHGGQRDWKPYGELLGAPGEAWVGVLCWRVEGQGRA